MKNRPLNMDAYGISYNAYMQLYHFCQQYHEKQLELEGMIGIASSMPRAQPYTVIREKKDKATNETKITKETWGCVTPHGKGQTSDPVSDAVIRREKLRDELRQIEQSAIEAAPDMYQELLRAVTTRDGYRKINPPCGPNQFAGLRRRFFYILWQKRNL